MKKDFEQFLSEQHAEQYCGTKNGMVDDYADWISDLSPDEFIEFGDEFAKKQSQGLLEACRMAHECVVTRASVRNYVSEKDKLQDRTMIYKTIEKLEQILRET